MGNSYFDAPDPFAASPEEGQTPQPQAQEGKFFDLGDAVAAPFRGIADAASGIYGLGRWASGNTLPAWDAHPLGQSTSTLGGLLEGAADFAVGFVPVAGFLGKATKAASWLERGLGALDLGETATNVLRQGATVAAKSAVAGFTVFDGHEKRLSNLIQENPSLANPITDYLSAKGDDSFIEGRLKNALEQAGLGVTLEGVLLGLKSIKVARDFRLDHPDAPPAEIQRAVDEAVPPEEMHAAAAKLQAPPDLFGEPAIPNLPKGTQEIPNTIDQKIGQQGAEGEPSPAPEAPPAPQQGPHEAIPGTPPQTSAQAGEARRQSIRQALADIGATKIDPEGFINDVHKVQASHEELAPGLEANLNVRDLTPDAKLQLGLDGIHLNLETMNADPAAVIRAGQILTKEAGVLSAAAHAGMSQQEILAAGRRSLGDLTGILDPQVLMGRVLAAVPRDLQNFEEIANRIVGTNLVLNKAAEAHVALLREYTAVEAGLKQGDLLELGDRIVRGTQQLAALSDAASAYGSISGRVLKSRQFMFGNDGFFKGIPNDPVEMARRINDAGGQTAVSNLVKQQMAALSGSGNPGLYTALRPTLGDKIFNAGLDYWMNAIVSGAKTAAAIVAGTTTMTIYRPLEKMLGSALVKGRFALAGESAQAALQDPVIAKQIGILTSLHESAIETWRFAKANGFLTDTFDPRYSIRDSAMAMKAPPISADAFGLDPESLGGKAADYIGQVVGFPIKLHGGISDAVKAVNYRSFARASLEQKAIEAGIPAEMIGATVQNQMDQLIYKGQIYSQRQLVNRALDEAAQANITEPTQVADYVKMYLTEHPYDPELGALSQEALNYGRANTFTTPADPKSMSGGLQRLINQHPVWRFVLPFINKPMNILGFAGQRLNPVGPLKLAAATVYPPFAETLANTRNSFLIDAMSKDPEKMADAVGRMATGASLGSYILMKAADGTVTGRGPSDPEQRRTLMESGWQPYSVKVGDGYVSYSRMEPFAALVGTMADIIDYAKFAPVEDAGTMSTLADGLMVAMANNFTNKTYLAGVANFVEALQQPDRKIQTVAQRYVGSFVPSILNQGDLAIGGDQNMRDVRSILDAAVARTPGLSDTLPPQRNVLGEPIDRIKALGTDSLGAWVDWWNPIGYRAVSDNIIKNEMADLRHGFTPPKRVVDGLDLSDVRMPSGQTAYDRWGELHGQVQVGGRNLQDALRGLIMSPEYKKLSPVTTGGLQSPRIDRIEGVINEYRARAYQQLLRESPELMAHEQLFQTQRRSLRAGIDTRLLPQ